MKRVLIQLLLCLFSFSAFALNTESLVSDPFVSKILKKKCIRLGTSEVLTLNFDSICKTLNHPQLIQNIQKEFCRSISETGEVDFPIHNDGNGKYHYINEKGKRTDIVELYKKKTDDFSYDYIVQAYGKRFFGKYNVIIHLQIINTGSGHVVYSVHVHAWPHNWLTRSAHKMGLTKSFFTKKMKLISWVAREVGTGLCELEEQKTAILEQASTSRAPY